MLETVREYALERLEDADAVRDRHARAFAALIEGEGERMEGPELPDTGWRAWTPTTTTSAPRCATRPRAVTWRPRSR